jgi:hypothetical protein
MDTVVETINVQNVPKALNGYPVAMATPHENGFVTVLVIRQNAPMPYVVATWWPNLKTTWMWGHYNSSPETAMDEFLTVSQFNEKRGKIN